MADVSPVVAGDQTNGSGAPLSSAVSASAPSASPAEPLPGEGSYTGRIVAVFTPVFVLVAGAIAGEVGHLIPGVQLDQSQIVALMVAVAGSALTGGWKWLQGWQQHEQNVADGKVQAWRSRPPASPRADITAPEPGSPPVAGSR